MDSHENEYRAAAAGMAETYGSPDPSPAWAPAVGDFVNGLTDDGTHWGGYVLEVRGNRAIIDADNGTTIGGWLDVPLSDITRR